MSTDPGYMLIRVDLQGARQAAAEAKLLQGSLAGVGSTAGTMGAQTAKQTSRGTRLWNGFTKAVKLGALGVAGAVAGIALATKGAIDDVKTLGLTAAGLRRNLGLTAEEGTRWAAIAKAREIAPTSLNMAFKTLSSTVSEANRGEETYIKTLKRLGLTNKQIKGGMEDFDGLLLNVADRFGEMEGGAKRQALAAKLLGRGYQTVLPLFASGSKGLEEYLGWADKYNVTMGDEMVDKTIALADAQRESKIAWMGIQRVLAQDFMDSVIDAHGAFHDFAEEFTDPKLTSEQRWQLLGDRMEQGFTRATDWVLNEGIPMLAEGVGQAAPKIAGALVRGFTQANVLGKIAIGWWLISKLTGKTMMGALGAAGAAMAKRLGGAFAAWFAGTQFGASMIGVFGKQGKLAGKLRGPLTSLGKWGGRLMGVGLAASLIIAFEDDIEKFFLDYRERLQEEGFGDTQDAPPIIDLGGAAGDVQDFLNDKLNPSNLFRAAGGPVSRDTPYIVGEEGPEWFVPKTAGTVLPNTGARDATRSAPSKSAGSVAGGMNLGEVTVVTPLYLDGKEVGRGVRRAALKSRARN